MWGKALVGLLCCLSAVCALPAQNRAQAAAVGQKIVPSMNFADYMGSLGFHVEEHFATTDDGYILRLYRVPGRNASSPVVILQHGILATMWCWVDNANPDLAPGVLLAKQGFELWFTNSRGNTFSRNHTTLSPDSAEFWDFTFADMAMFDVPTNVGYVLNKTGRSDLAFVGWSQGTSQMFIAASHAYWGPWLQGKIRVFAALSPVTYLKGCTSLLIEAMAKFDLADVIYRVYPKGFLDGSQTMSSVEQFFCKITFGKLCSLSVDSICGTSELDDVTSIENFSAHFPAGTSTKDMVHYEQFVDTLRFGEYDYGSAGNKIHYNQTTAPSYNLTSISIPVALFAGTNDDLVPASDLAKLKAELNPSTVVGDHLYKDFSHMTWMVGDAEAAYWLEDLVAAVTP